MTPSQLILSAAHSPDPLATARRILAEHGQLMEGGMYRDAMAKLFGTLAAVKHRATRPGVHRALIYCVMMLINRCELSVGEVASLCGVTKSDVSRWKRQFERQWGVESAGVRRSFAARRKFSAFQRQEAVRRRERRERELSAWCEEWRSL
jgi:hypothetical protein